MKDRFPPTPLACSLAPTFPALPMRILSTAVLAAVAALAACDRPPTEPTPRPDPGLHFVAGQPGTDSIEAVLPDLVVEVRDARGRVAPGVVVTFTVPEEDLPRLAVSRSGVAWRWHEATDTSDVNGRASARVAFGIHTGAGRVAVAAPSLGFQDTARYTVQPGALARIRLSPADSVVYVGNSYTLGAAAVDRHGNPRADAVTLAAGGQKISVAGGAVRGESVGRAFVVAAAGARQDTAWVSVVPRGVLTATQGYYYRPDGTLVAAGGIVTMNLDGSEFRELRAGTGTSAPMLRGTTPAWSPDGSEISFHSSDERLVATDLAGGVRVVREGDIRLTSGWPALYSRDGAWIYFVRGRPGELHSIWRMRPDGTGAEQASQTLDWGIESAPSPAPDGRRLAYQTNRVTNDPINFTLRVIDVPTGTVTRLDVAGRSPRWSPTGEWIAYLARDPGTLHVMRPDGSGIRQVGNGVGAHDVFSWSPDGQWLLTSGNQPLPGAPHHIGLFLVHVTTGEVLPLTFRRDYMYPDWRP